MFLGLVFLNRTAMLVGFPVNSNTIKTAVVGSPAASTDTNYKTGADGIVEVPLTINNTQYEPAALSIPADKPVRIVVTRNEDVACSDAIVFPQLGVSKDLVANGVTNVDLPAAKAGTYTMTCGMGMMSGQLVVGGGAASSAGGGISPVLWLVFAAGAAAGAFYLARGARSGRPAPAHATSGGGAAHGKGAQGSKATHGGKGTHGGNQQPSKKSQTRRAHK
jgi:hypothetical protein